MSLLLRWLLNAAALYAIAMAAPYVGMLQGFELGGFQAAIVAVAILSILNLTVRPILKLLTLPITCLTFGLFTLVINALMMMLTDELVPEFEVGGFLNALMLSVIYAILSAMLNTLLNAAQDRKD